MPKRNYATEDDEEPVSNSSTKRARTADSDQEDDDLPRTQTKSRRDKGKSRAPAKDLDDDQDDRDDQEEEDGDDEDEDEDGEIQPQAPEMDEEQLDAQYGAAIRAQLENKKKVQGGIAEHGIIEYIEMTQFMCHKFLRFTFGPQINFIIGHNGSGKSAVLSAITVALGGKTASTGRGTGIKSFIREGQGKSEVTIHIKNQGDEAYKPHEYGSTIVITRCWSKDGSSSWRIKSKNGKTISTKKDELAAICDHMNIQVDNPMNVLTQDAARQFLSASSPQEKYKLFLRGTQLTQLSEEYDLCYSNINQTQKLLVVKKEAIPDLRARTNEATARYQEATKAREQKKRADDLKKELAWAHVAGKEEELSKKMEEAAKLARRLPKIEESVEKAEEAFHAATQQVEQYEAEFREIGTVDNLVAEKNRIQDQMKAKKEVLKNLNADVRQMNASLETTNNQILEIDQQIEKESRRMAQQTQSKHDETQRKIDEEKRLIEQCDTRLPDIIMERKNTGLDADRLYERGTEDGKKLRTLQDQIQHCEEMIKTSKEKEHDALIPYGRNIKSIIGKINAMRWMGEKPLGPLGQYVKARDPGKWGDILRSQLTPLLCAFAVTDARDRAPLKKLFHDTGNHHINILIYEKDMFDYGSGEPPQDKLTVLRALDISDQYVLRLFINQARIESQILASTRREAEAILRSLPRGGSAWSLDRFSVRVYADGGVVSSPLNLKRFNDAMSLLLTGRDTASEVRHFSREKMNVETEYKATLQRSDEMKAQWTPLRRRIDELNDEEKRVQQDRNKAKQRLTQLIQEANDDLPAGLAALEESKADAEREKEALMQQAEGVVRQKAEIDNEQKLLLLELNKIKNSLTDFEGRRTEKNKLIDAAVEARLKAQNDKKYFENKYKTEKEKVDAADDAAKVLEEEFTNWTEKAAEYCERVPNPRKPDEVKRMLESVQKALKDQEQHHGATVEEMAKELNKTKEILEKAQKELKQMVQLNKALRQSLIVRINRWQEFRSHIALRCKHVFQFHLSQRGYYGKILFNHDQGSLQLRVQTDDQLQTQGPKEKDPRSLSGGEKSFSTICLLLSLWESIGCPLRCLDEFDVFMDAVNRRISMKMMIDTANTSDKKQYILITPQDMTNVMLGPTVKVHRMSDPERGNGTLPFGSASS